VLPSGQKLTLGLLATITLEVVLFCAYAPFPAFLCQFLNASWKSCSIRVFSTACDSALINFKDQIKYIIMAQSQNVHVTVGNKSFNNATTAVPAPVLAILHGSL
jgi:hypothetical protein